MSNKTKILSQEKLNSMGIDEVEKQFFNEVEKLLNQKSIVYTEGIKSQKSTIQQYDKESIDNAIKGLKLYSKAICLIIKKDSPEAAHQFHIVSNVGINIIQNLITPPLGFGTVLGVINSLFGLAGLFGSNKESPTEKFQKYIANMLQSISKGIAKLHERMEIRFSYVHEHLNQIQKENRHFFFKSLSSLKEIQTAINQLSIDLNYHDLKISLKIDELKKHLKKTENILIAIHQQKGLEQLKQIDNILASYTKNDGISLGDYLREFSKIKTFLENTSRQGIYTMDFGKNVDTSSINATDISNKSIHEVIGLVQQCARHFNIKETVKLPNLTLYKEAIIVLNKYLIVFEKKFPNATHIDTEKIKTDCFAFYKELQKLGNKDLIDRVVKAYSFSFKQLLLAAYQELNIIEKESCKGFDYTPTVLNKTDIWYNTPIVLLWDNPLDSNVVKPQNKYRIFKEKGNYYTLKHPNAIDKIIFHELIHINPYSDFYDFNNFKRQILNKIKQYLKQNVGFDELEEVMKKMEKGDSLSREEILDIISPYKPLEKEVKTAFDKLPHPKEFNTEIKITERGKEYINNNTSIKCKVQQQTIEKNNDIYIVNDIDTTKVNFPMLSNDNIKKLTQYATDLNKHEQSNNTIKTKPDELNFIELLTIGVLDPFYKNLKKNFAEKLVLRLQKKHNSLIQQFEDSALALLLFSTINRIFVQEFYVHERFYHVDYLDDIYTFDDFIGVLNKFLIKDYTEDAKIRLKLPSILGEQVSLLGDKIIDRSIVEVYEYVENKTEKLKDKTKEITEKHKYPIVHLIII